VVLEIKPLGNEELVDLAQTTLRNKDEEFKGILSRIAEALRTIRGYEQVSPAEYLDTVKAIQILGAEESQWRDIIMQTSWTASMADRG
jgi:hypothetical protein